MPCAAESEPMRGRAAPTDSSTPTPLLVQDRVCLRKEVVDGGRDGHLAKRNILTGGGQKRRQRRVAAPVGDVFDESTGPQMRLDLELLDELRIGRPGDSRSEEHTSE